MYPPRRVLIVSDQEADREAIRLLLGSMGCRWILATTTEEAVAILNREPIAAAIMDARLAVWDSAKKNESFREILLRLPGRVILLSESDGTGPIEFAGAYSLPTIKRERWAQDLWGNLETLLNLPATARLTKETARLALDTLTQPLPQGIRQTQANIRHLLYETSALSVDVSLERVPDSNSILLAGQILTRFAPQRAFQGAPVALLVDDRLLGLATTNQAGEFLFEFEKEPNVTLEIEDRPSHCVRIHTPKLTAWTTQTLQKSRARSTDKLAPNRGLTALSGQAESEQPTRTGELAAEPQRSRQGNTQSGKTHDRGAELTGAKVNARRRATP